MTLWEALHKGTPLACVPVVQSKPSTAQKQPRKPRPDVPRCQNVYWHVSSGKWRIEIKHDGIKKSGGYFDKYEDAVEARHKLYAEMEGW